MMAGLPELVAKAERLRYRVELVTAPAELGTEGVVSITPPVVDTGVIQLRVNQSINGLAWSLAKALEQERLRTDRSEA